MPGKIHATVAIIPARKKLVGLKPKRFERGQLISVCPTTTPITVKTATFKLNLSIFLNISYVKENKAAK